MSVIKLDNVFLEYVPFEEEVEQPKKEKKNKKKKGEENAPNSAVFEGFEAPQIVTPPKVVNHTYALSDISLEIEAGQNVALVGRNGSGKSTLAKLLNGLLLPNLGKVYVFGMDTWEKSQLFDIRKNVGMVFQNPDNQMIASIVEDDIAFGPENIGVPANEIRQRVDWALSCVGMLEYKDATPFKLSGGQKQRIAIAGMLALKPKILVLDESTAMLDPKGRGEVMEVVKKLNRDEGMTIINITHYMDEVMDADRVVVLSNGKIVADGTPQQIFSERSKLVSLGLDIPNIMQIADKVREQGLGIGDDIYTVEELVSRIWKLSQTN